MTSDDLTREQAEKLKAQVARQLRWLNKLQSRMEKLRFLPDDPIMREVLRTRASMQDLFVAAHYAACKHGVGKPEAQ